MVVFIISCLVSRGFGTHMLRGDVVPDASLFLVGLRLRYRRYHGSCRYGPYRTRVGEIETNLFHHILDRRPHFFIFS